MLNTNQWNEFKESVREAGFPLDMLDDERRDLRLSDKQVWMQYVENYLTVEELETLTNEEITDASMEYIKEHVKPQLKDEEGNDDWYDETYEMWLDIFQYAALFHRLVAFEVESKFR